MKFQREKEEDMKIRIVVVMLVAIMLTALIGCATVGPLKELPPIAVTYEMPVLTPVEGSPQDQERHGIRVSVAPYPFSASREVQRQYKILSTSVAHKLSYMVESPLIGKGHCNVEMKETPYYVVEPKRVYFKVKVYNNLGHVLRLTGTVVAFQVDGTLTALDTAGYEDFLKGIVLPRQEMEYVIFGPSTDSMPQSCNIALLLYDIVTETDAAGNPTERTSFEWYYTFNKATVVKSERVNIQNIKMTPEEAERVGAQ